MGANAKQAVTFTVKLAAFQGDTSQVISESFVFVPSSNSTPKMILSSSYDKAGPS